MDTNNLIRWEDLRASFAFTKAEEAQIAAERSRLLSEVRAQLRREQVLQ